MLFFLFYIFVKTSFMAWLIETHITTKYNHHRNEHRQRHLPVTKTICIAIFRCGKSSQGWKGIREEAAPYGRKPETSFRKSSPTYRLSIICRARPPSPTAGNPSREQIASTEAARTGLSLPVSFAIQRSLYWPTWAGVSVSQKWMALWITDTLCFPMLLIFVTLSRFNRENDVLGKFHDRLACPWRKIGLKTCIATPNIQKNQCFVLRDLGWHWISLFLWKWPAKLSAKMGFRHFEVIDLT